MNHLVRRIIFWSFFSIFIVLTLYFSLMASGYTISFSSISIKNPYSLNFLQKTGILAINSNPRGADVSLFKNFKTFLTSNEKNKDKRISTPNKVKNLTPGEYILKLELDGYWDFEQKINIYPGQTTYLENIVLFKKSLPLMIFPSKVQDLAISDDFSTLILKEDNILFDIKNEIDFFDSSFFEKDNLENLEKIYGNLDIESVDNYLISKNYLFLIIEKNNKKYLNIYFNRDKKLIREIEMPVYSDFEICFFNNKFLLVKDINFSSFYILDVFSRIKIFRELITEVNNINFISKDSFIYSKNSEIYFFDFFNFQNILISRFEDEIKSLLWHPREYLIFSNGKDINIIDLKYENSLTKIFSFDDMSNLVIDKKGGILYFTAKIANQEGLYKLLIQ